MTVEPERDRWGRPLILQPDGTTVAYTRASTLGKALTDSSGLTKWKLRQVLLGVGRRPDLYARAATADPAGRNGGLDEVAEQALAAAESSRGANLGTAIHSATELVDRGEPLSRVPDVVREHVAAYLDLIKPLGIEGIEEFVVNDPLQAAGTFDRLYRLPDGAVVIGDLKTGRADSPKYAAGEWAVQLAVYAGGQRYDPDDGSRSRLHPDLDPSRGLIVHLPADGTRPGLFTLNLDWGRAAADLAVRVRKFRSTTFHATLELGA